MGNSYLFLKMARNKQQYQRQGHVNLICFKSLFMPSVCGFASLRNKSTN